MMKDTKEYSPFYKIRRTLVLLRWTFGFPLQSIDDSYTEFRFVLWLECLRFSVVYLMIMLSFVYWLFVVLIVDGNLENFITLFKELQDTYSKNKIDHYLVLLLYVNAVIMSFSYILYFKYNTQSINIFCNEVVIIKSKMAAILINKGKEGQQTHCMIIQNSEKLIIYGQIFNAITSFLHGLWNYNICITLPKDHLVYQYGSNYQLFIPPMFAITKFFIWYGPISCAVELLICQVINSLSDLFNDWKTMLQGKPRLHPIYLHQQVSNTKSSDDLETSKM